MKILYFDAFAGASGDMILGALVGAGVEERELVSELKLLGVARYEIEFKSVMRAGLSATHAIVRTETETTHRGLNDILAIINNSPLGETVKERAATIFRRLAEAEAQVHNEPVERIHFHEVGGTDAIIDIVGACIGFEMLEVKTFAASPLHTGSGTVEMAHGRFPVPPPAVVELVKSAPIYSTDITGELLTPTGAAIITTLCAGHIGAMPRMRVENAGYGAGSRDYPRFPNVLRVIVGEIEGDSTDMLGEGNADTKREHLTMIETNVDDMSGQVTAYVMERLLAAGALDCYFTSVQMKKNRPGVLISVLSRRADVERLRQLLFQETTTLGVRTYEVERRALRREFRSIETEFGAIDVKVAYVNGSVRGGEPEFEQCRRMAEETGVPVRAVLHAARRAFDAEGREVRETKI